MVVEIVSNISIIQITNTIIPMLNRDTTIDFTLVLSINPFIFIEKTKGEINTLFTYMFPVIPNGIAANIHTNFPMKIAP